MAACEAEPLDIGSQAEPRNQFNQFNILVTRLCLVTQLQRLCLEFSWQLARQSL